MAEQYPQGNANNTNSIASTTKEPGCFDFMRKKEEKLPQEDLVMTDQNAAEDQSKEEEKHTQLQRTHSHSSSSSEEEVEEGGERKKKKTKKGEETEQTDIFVPMEKCNEEENAERIETNEKKGFIEKIKEKLPGQHKKGEEEDVHAPPACDHSPGNDIKEKKGIIDKIKEKLPGQHKSNGNELKED
ncbi:hypothetical protein ACJIZ3_015247 [Penstemon smallii]|uniref:Dehydrin n=1 Tax=Penstemon smallii TaxID=265156 RepID=A0ABD3RM05_9LAMI